MECRGEVRIFLPTIREPLHRKGQTDPVDGQKAHAVLNTVEQRTHDAATIQAISRKYGD